jgi:hypothetical protein
MIQLRISICITTSWLPIMIKLPRTTSNILPAIIAAFAKSPAADIWLP